MTRRRAKSRSLTVFLIKDGLNEPEEILEDIDDLGVFRVNSGGSIIGNLYVRGSHTHPPAWISFFEGAVDTSKFDVWNSSSAAVLLVNSHGRVFAVTFGYGRHLLRPASYEENFGLLTVLNSINRERIRVIEKRSIESISRSTREQSSREVDLTEFGLDPAQDLLRTITGTPDDTESLGLRLSGTDALVASGPIELLQLPQRLGRYLECARDTRYREHFPWVDHLARIYDKVLLEELNAELIESVVLGHTENIWLAVPDLIEWTDVGGFRFSSAKSSLIHPDIHLNEYLEEKGGASSVTLQRLKQHRIECISLSGDYIIDRWSLYKCINAELEKDDKMYLLSGGCWYQISTDYVEQVNNGVEQIPEADLSLPDYADLTETHYNERVAKSKPGVFALMDRKLIMYGGAASRLEFCDLYSVDRKIIHIKRYSGSATLSHLFSQGLVSASLLLTDAVFREKLQDLLPDTHKFNVPSEQIRPSEFEIVFAIISNQPKPLRLPFFSRVTLRAAARQLQGFGFSVALAKIDVIELNAETVSSEVS